MKRFLKNNGLSLVLFVLFFFTFLVGQSVTGHLHYNNEQQEHGQPTVGYVEYLGTSHFLEATMENWESEFLQMFFFVVLTVFLYQKGSAESKDPNKKGRGRPRSAQIAQQKGCGLAGAKRWRDTDNLRAFVVAGISTLVSRILFTACGWGRRRVQ